MFVPSVKWFQCHAMTVAIVISVTLWVSDQCCKDCCTTKSDVLSITYHSIVLLSQINGVFIRYSFDVHMENNVVVSYWQWNFLKLASKERFLNLRSFSTLWKTFFSFNFHSHKMWIIHNLSSKNIETNISKWDLFSSFSSVCVFFCQSVPSVNFNIGGVDSSLFKS